MNYFKTKNELKKLIFSSFMLLMIYSCSPIYYAPSNQAMPELTEKNDLVFSGTYLSINSSTSYQLLGNTSGTQLSIAYSPINKFGLGLSYNNANDISSSRWNKFDFSLGYYNTIDSSFSYNIYLVNSLGNLKWIDTFEEQALDLSARMWSIAIRPSISYQTNSFRFGLGSNIKRLGFRNITEETTDSEYSGYLKNNNLHTLIEPSLTITFDGDKSDFLLQLGRSFNVTNPDFRQHKNYISLGVNLSI